MAGLKQFYVRLDRQTVAAAERALEGAGLSADEAVELMLTRTARDKALPLSSPLEDQEAARVRQAAREGSARGAFSFWLNERVFDEALLVLKNRGLFLDEVIEATLARVARDGVLPLSPNAETRAAMEEAERGESVSFGSVEELLADLNADD